MIVLCAKICLLIYGYCSVTIDAVSVSLLTSSTIWELIGVTIIFLLLFSPLFCLRAVVEAEEQLSKDHSLSTPSLNHKIYDGYWLIRF